MRLIELHVGNDSPVTAGTADEDCSIKTIKLSL
jgi:hypothetical protein